MHAGRGCAGVRWPARGGCADGKVHVLYRAEDSVGTFKGTSRIGLAVSHDGFEFAVTDAVCIVRAACTLRTRRHSSAAPSLQVCLSVRVLLCSHVLSCWCVCARMPTRARTHCGPQDEDRHRQPVLYPGGDSNECCTRERKFAGGGCHKFCTYDSASGMKRPNFFGKTKF